MNLDNIELYTYDIVINNGNLVIDKIIYKNKYFFCSLFHYFLLKKYTDLDNIKNIIKDFMDKNNYYNDYYFPKIKKYKDFINQMNQIEKMLNYNIKIYHELIIEGVNLICEEALLWKSSNNYSNTIDILISNNTSSFYIIEKKEKLLPKYFVLNDNIKNIIINYNSYIYQLINDETSPILDDWGNKCFFNSILAVKDINDKYRENVKKLIKDLNLNNDNMFDVGRYQQKNSICLTSLDLIEKELNIKIILFIKLDFGQSIDKNIKYKIFWGKDLFKNMEEINKKKSYQENNKTIYYVPIAHNGNYHFEHVKNIEKLEYKLEDYQVINYIYNLNKKLKK